MSEGVIASDLGRKKVKVDVIVADVSADIVVSGRLTVPPPKPDIASILDTQARVAITQVSVIPSKVVIQGNVEVNVLYVSTAPSQPVHFFEGTLPLFGSVHVPGIFPSMIPEVRVVAVFATARLVDPRTVDVNVLVSVRVRVVREEIIPVVIKVPPIIVPAVEVPVVPVVKEKVVAVERVVLEGEAQTIAVGTISIPPDKPSVDKIIRTDAVASVTSVRVLHGKVVVSGVVSVRILYVALAPGQPVFSVDGAITFSTIVSLPGVVPSMFAFASVHIEAVDTDIVGPRTLRVRAVVRVSVVVMVEKEVTLITAVKDLPAPLIAVKRDFLVEEIVGQVEDDSSVTVRLIVPTALPDIGRVIQAFARPRVVKVVVLDGIVIVEGTLRVTVLFATLPAQRVFAVVETVPFTVTLRVTKAIPALFAVADVDVVKVTAVPVDPRSANVKVVLRGWTMVTRVDTVSAVVDVNPSGEGAGASAASSGSGALPGPPVGAEPAGATGRVHVVKIGETLFQIAQRYGTTVAAIVQANNIADPDRIEVGDTIVIPG
ncbi:MAG: SPOCS domain-containing protein [Bacillota bacterium]